MVRKSECPPEYQDQLKRLLEKHHAVLADRADPVGYCDVYEPSIPLDTEEPIYTPQ